MGIFKKMAKKIKDNTINREQNKRLSDFQDKYQNAKRAYTKQLEKMNEYESMYDGERAVKLNPNRGDGYSNKLATNVRNIVFELLESEVDSSIPMPKVTPIHAEDEQLANNIENMLHNEIRLLKLNTMNDLSERTTFIQGGDFFHVEWDNTKGFHCTLGGLSVSEMHPRTVIPQPGITEIENMDYIFVLVPQTKEFVKRKYDVDVEDAMDTETQLREAEGRELSDNLVTVIKCYYRNEENNIGLFSWVDDFVLEDIEDYQARRLMRCKKCGKVKVGDVCECGSRTFEETKEEYEEIQEDIIQLDGTKIEANYEENVPEVDENGAPIIGENGLPIEKVIQKKVKVPYYKPDEMPIILRRNVSVNGKLLGNSDVRAISDQQETIKKLGSKMNEKLLKGGSIVTLPNGSKIQTTDEELKIVRVKSPNEMAMIDVKNIQADVSMDRMMLETNYDWAKSTLGITDAYQGKYDSSAKSGTAKQYSINQAAGRLESKRVMKNEAYSNLYRLMFKLMLAYADQPIPLSKKNQEGNYEFSHFNRYDFLKVDDAGEFYWDDEFIFETDPTSTIMMNREAMWEMIDLKYQAGAFGEIGQPETLLTYWTFMELNDYPNSSAMKDIFTQKVIEQKQMEQQQMEQQQMQMQAQEEQMPAEQPM